MNFSLPTPRVLQFFIFYILLFHVIKAQDTPNRADYRLHAAYTTERVDIDGKLDESVWAEAEIARDFYRILPIDTGFASAQTEVMVAHDEDHMYMAIISHDTVAGKRPVESLRRDFSFGLNDNFLAFIDTYNDQTNGFSFGISAAGAQWDGLQANGGFVSLDWDCKWRSEIVNHEDKWIAEFAIPFRSIRYQEGVKEWGINFSRLDLKQNEKSSWAPVPRQFQSANLAYTGTLVWDRPPPKLGTRFSLIPYVSGRVSQDFENPDDTDAIVSGDVGFDAKVTLSTSMNLDLTVNPDFSQVEVDRQVTNLDRFELFFPERRQFFLENSDLFASLGTESIRPFFSRRIGLDAPVRAGARLSGKLGSDWRLGLMNIQTGSRRDIPANNFSVAVLQKKIFSRSNVGVFMVNRERTTDVQDSTYSGSAFNRVAGVDFNLASADNKWTGKFFYHQAFTPEGQANDFAMSGQVEYATQEWSVAWNQAWVQDDYQAEVGFVRRRGFHRMNPELNYRFYPSNSRLANHGPSFEMTNFFNTDFKLTDREVELGYTFQWLNRSAFTVEYENGFVKLLAPFDPTNTGGDTLATGSEYNWNELSLNYVSDARKLFSYEIQARYGGFFNGERLSLESQINYRVQPFGKLAMLASYNRLILPEPFEDANLVLIGPRLDITFTDNLFLTTFIQYNNQIENVNVNMRFQWRFAPVSDLFIVYTDNSYPDGLSTKNRQLVAKISYWLN